MSTSGPMSKPEVKNPAGTPRKPLPMMTLIAKHATCHAGSMCRFASSKTKTGVGESSSIAPIAAASPERTALNTGCSSCPSAGLDISATTDSSTLSLRSSPGMIPVRFC